VSGSIVVARARNRLPKRTSGSGADLCKCDALPPGRALGDIGTT
jgi:hypothetical protein